MSSYALAIAAFSIVTLILIGISSLFVAVYMWSYLIMWACKFEPKEDNFLKTHRTKGGKQ